MGSEQGGVSNNTRSGRGAASSNPIVAEWARRCRVAKGHTQTVFATVTVNAVDSKKPLSDEFDDARTYCGRRVSEQCLDGLLPLNAKSGPALLPDEGLIAVVHLQDVAPVIGHGLFASAALHRSLKLNFPPN